MSASTNQTAPKEGLFKGLTNYLRTGGGREDLTAIGTGAGGIAVAVAAIYFVVGSVQSSHEKISMLTESVIKERELRDKDTALLTESVLKERELRDKDAAIMRLEQEVSAAKRAAMESELRAVKMELENALKAIDRKTK
jgi:hypothetical protein